jgi:hypothetical protein
MEFLDARKRDSVAVNDINNRDVEFVVTPNMMLDIQGSILKKKPLAKLETYS